MIPSKKIKEIAQQKWRKEKYITYGGVNTIDSIPVPFYVAAISKFLDEQQQEFDKHIRFKKPD